MAKRRALSIFKVKEQSEILNSRFLNEPTFPWKFEYFFFIFLTIWLDAILNESTSERIVLLFFHIHIMIECHVTFSF